MLPKLVTLAGFQQRAGITLEQLQNAAFAGTLPASVGEIDGVPHWLESDVERFILLTRASNFTEPKAAPVPVASAPDALSKTTESAPPAALTRSASGTAATTDDVPLTALERALEDAFHRMPSKAPYRIGHMPPALFECVPTDLHMRDAVLDESKRRDTYDLEQMSEYFGGVTVSRIKKTAVDYKPIDKHGNRFVYSHDVAMQIWAAEPDRRVIPTRSIHGQNRLYSWVDLVRRSVRLRVTGKKAKVLQTPHDVMLIDPQFGRAEKEAAKAAPRPVKIESEPAPVFPSSKDVVTVSVAEPAAGDWVGERMVSDMLDLPLEVIRIIRKDKIGPACAYRNGIIQYRVIDVESWRAANLPVIATLKAKDEVWMDYPQAAQLVGLPVHALQKICSPNYKGANKGPAGVMRDRRMMFKESSLIAWRTHHKHIIERHHKNSALRGDIMRNAQKLAVIANKEKRAKELAAERGQVEPARRLLDEAPIVPGKKVVKKANPVANAVQRAMSEPSKDLIASGKATMADVLKTSTTLGAGLRLP